MKRDVSAHQVTKNAAMIIDRSIKSGELQAYNIGGLWPEVALFAVYLTTSLFGLYKWGGPGV